MVRKVRQSPERRWGCRHGHVSRDDSWVAGRCVQSVQPASVDSGSAPMMLHRCHADVSTTSKMITRSVAAAIPIMVIFLVFYVGFNVLAVIA